MGRHLQLVLAFHQTAYTAYNIYVFELAKGETVQVNFV